MGSISIHPKLACNVQALQKVQFETGLRAVFTGGTYAQLAAPGAAIANPPRPAAPVAIKRSRHSAGYGELCTCTQCERKTNVQTHGETCWRCRTGVIVRDGGNGGSAA